LTTTTRNQLLKAGVLALILITGIIIGRRSKPAFDKALFDFKMASKDDTIRFLTKEREAINDQIQMQEDLMDQLKIKDSLISAKYISDQKVYQLLNEKFKTIDNVISVVSGNSDSLIAAYHRYQ